MSDSLFWYPGRSDKWEDYNKCQMLEDYVLYFLNRVQSMFKYENLPDTIPAKWLEHYLLCNGNCIITKDNEGRLMAYLGEMGTLINAYYIPCGYLVSNPYFDKGVITTTDEVSKGFSKMFKIGTDCEIIYNDTYSMGVLPLIRKWCRQLVENDITMDIADILARATINISAADDGTKASAELYLKQLRDGKLGVMSSNAFIEGLNISNFGNVAASLTNLIEYHQYIKASLFNELGLNSNYNMKRESINSNESQLNDDMLHPLIDTMLRERQEGIDRVNKMFGTDIKVSFNSAWEANEIEEEATHDLMQAEAVAAEVAVIEEVAGETTEDVSTDIDSDTDNMDTENNVDVSEDTETVDEVTEDVTIDNGTGMLTENEVNEVADTIEEIVEVFDDLEGGEDDVTEDDK